MGGFMKFNDGRWKKVIYITVVSFTILSCNLFSGTPKISVKEAKLVPSPMLIGVASAFMLIFNKGDASDKLIGCSIKEYPSVKGRLHDVIQGKMQRIEEIEIPANEVVMLKKGGLHLMFYGLPENITDEVTIVLNFKKIGSIEIKARVYYPLGSSTS
jgi:hypothetical protein